MAAKRSVYPKLVDSKEFRTRAEAESWGKKQKQEYKQQGETVKTDINFQEGSRGWKVRLFLKT